MYIVQVNTTVYKTAVFDCWPNPEQLEVTPQKCIESVYVHGLRLDGKSYITNPNLNP